MLPELARAAATRPIRIWSAPCATGEEPLTIAMVLEETGWFQRLPIEIHASDASTAAIDKARAGRYRERSFRALPPDLREKYFVARRRRVCAGRVAERQRISSWSVVNLMDARERARRTPRARSCSAATLHLFLAAERQAGRPHVRRTDADARAICSSARPSRCYR